MAVYSLHLWFLKTIINLLCFCVCISLLNIIRNLVNWILNQYERDGVVIPCNLKENIFTIIEKDNIDHNALSTTATKHTKHSHLSVSICSFQYDMISYPKELPTTTKLTNLKIWDPFLVTHRRLKILFTIYFTYIFDSTNLSPTWFWQSCSSSRSKGGVWMVRKCIWR